MNLQERLQETQQNFNTRKAEREDYLEKAETCLEEMHCLRGEYRLLTDLITADAEAMPADVDPAASVSIPSEVNG